VQVSCQIQPDVAKSTISSSLSFAVRRPVFSDAESSPILYLMSVLAVYVISPLVVRLRMSLPLSKPSYVGRH